jgi:hypothetical protein
MLQVYREDVRREWPFTLKHGDRELGAAERAGTMNPDFLKRGRRKGESWSHADVPCFEEMRRRLKTSQAKDIKAAATQVQECAVNHHGGTPKSVAKRLARDYTRWIKAQPIE